MECFCKGGRRGKSSSHGDQKEKDPGIRGAYNGALAWAPSIKKPPEQKIQGGSGGFSSLTYQREGCFGLKVPFIR
jgi:hypothetical protein